MKIDLLFEGQIQSLFFEFLSERFNIKNEFLSTKEFSDKVRIDDENKNKENVITNNRNKNDPLNVNEDKTIQEKSFYENNNNIIDKIINICDNYRLNNVDESNVHNGELKKKKYYLDFNIWENDIVVGILGLGKFCSITLYNMLIKKPELIVCDYDVDFNGNIIIDVDDINDLICNRLNIIEKDTCLNYFKLFSYLSGSNTYIYPTGFRPIIKEIINRHKALNFLRENNEVFSDLFMNTVITRIYYELDLLELKRLRYKDIKNSNIFSILNNIKGEETFDDLIHYFNYQHFYVLYYRFIELDNDEDHELSFSEFKSHDNNSITEFAANRIWNCNIQNKNSLFNDNLANKDRNMSYYDFLYFYISDEDKTSDRSIRYWFEIIDLDCDGWISKEEIEFFYNEQKKRVDDLNYSLPEFNSILCMMNDLLMPTIENQFRLDDFVRNKLVAGHFFNILVNTKKCITTILMDGEFNTINSFLQSEKISKYISPWDLHCYYQYQIIQGSNNDENI
ncbi:phosphatase 2A regulatory subunit (contains a conserved version of EF hands) [Cryptosporidium bovis]|uniref:phosphatase 2A regulatory subunit (contains a conserved version of EF hands) n=1 Tax=Cryptosporidium bovis TaxID=310047 RepID=UPI003519EB75|nr:phosphatase 2A regulatory subunit (contains a conserved version of EF hands) [Cryptosporidium bovis]